MGKPESCGINITCLCQICKFSVPFSTEKKEFWNLDCDWPATKHHTIMQLVVKYDNLVI
jgi:hypothetical protein